MAWRNCYASDTLIREINAMAPRRSKASDGTVGDLAHSARRSDHNPNAQGVVRARDITRAGLDLPGLFERLRRMGQAGDPRLAGGGYLILDRRITRPDFSGWKAYTGSNPHVKHGHVSFSKNRAGYDSRAAWGLADAPTGLPAPPADGRRTLQLADPRMTGADVHEVLVVLDRWYPDENLVTDDVFGPHAERAVRRLQANWRPPLVVDGRVGPATRRALGIR